MKRNMKSLLCMIAVLCLVLAGCNTGGGQSSSAPASEASGVETPGSSEGDAPATSSKDTLVVAIGGEPKSLDAQGVNDATSTSVKHQIYDTLLLQDPSTQEIRPNLAESWEFTDDTTLVVKLREGVLFHNGEEMKASDLLFTLTRGIDSEFTNWMVSTVDINNTSIVDDYTVEIKLTEPTGPLLAQFCFMYVVNEKAVTELGDEEFSNNPVGTGAFRFSNWVRSDRIELTAFDDYWGGRASYDNLTFRIITEAASRSIEVESGGVDVIYNVLPSDLPRLESDPNVQLVRGPGYSLNFIGFNCVKAPYDDIQLRQAINYAIDTKAIVNAVYEGTGSAATGPLPPSVWGYTADTEQYDYNPDKARELLADAGYEEGLKVTITTSDSQQRIDTAEIVQNQLGAVGIQTEVQILENATYLDRIINGDFEIFILGWVTNTGDADYGLYEPYHTGTPTWSNTTRYSNTRVDELLEIGAKSTDESTRMAAYVEAQQIIAEESPAVFTWVGEEILCARSNIRGLESNPSGRYDFSKVVID